MNTSIISITIIIIIVVIVRSVVPHNREAIITQLLCHCRLSVLPLLAADSAVSLTQAILLDV